MTPNGALVLVGGERGGGRVFGGFDRQMRAPLVSMFGGQKLRGLVAKEKAEDLESLTGLIESGAVTPVIDRTFVLAEAPDAIRYLAEGHATGKVAVIV
jgi:NADPH:quinone reductase-like Zn-dependent oxidoreductase